MQKYGGGVREARQEPERAPGERAHNEWRYDLCCLLFLVKIFSMTCSTMLYGKHAHNLMKTDVRETDQAYELDIDLPGFKKEDVQAKLENGYLTVSASKGLNRDEKDKKGRYIRRERYTGQCSRSFYVGDDVEPEQVSAKFEDGILKLTVPKKAEKKLPEQSSIQIN